MNPTPAPLVSPTASLSLPSPRPEPPGRSPRTSLILAALARQRRHERRQRRSARARRAAWLARFDGCPFELTRTQATPGVVFSGTMPLVYVLLPSA